MPEETHVPDLNQYDVQWPDSTGKGSDQAIPDVIGAMRTPNVASTQASGEHHVIMATRLHH